MEFQRATVWYEALHNSITVWPRDNDATSGRLCTLYTSLTCSGFFYRWAFRILTTPRLWCWPIVKWAYEITVLVPRVNSVSYVDQYIFDQYIVLKICFLDWSYIELWGYLTVNVVLVSLYFFQLKTMKTYVVVDNDLLCTSGTRTENVLRISITLLRYMVAPEWRLASYEQCCRNWRYNRSMCMYTVCPSTTNASPWYFNTIQSGRLCLLNPLFNLVLDVPKWWKSV